MHRILLATDLTGRCDRALERAIMLARDHNAELTILHVLDRSLPELVLVRHEEAARETIDAFVKSKPDASGLRVEQAVVRGDGCGDIIEGAEERDSDLIVLGLHRHDTPQMFRGTTADRVLRYSSRPVLVVKNRPASSYRKALVAVDLSAQATAAMALAARLVPNGEMRLVHATHRPFTAFLSRDSQNRLIADENARVGGVLNEAVRKLGEKIGETAPRTELVMRAGNVAGVIHEQIAAWKPDFMAIGTHGRTGLAHGILGSIAEGFLANAPTDVLSVKVA